MGWGHSQIPASLGWRAHPHKPSPAPCVLLSIYTLDNNSPDPWRSQTALKSSAQSHHVRQIEPRGRDCKCPNLALESKDFGNYSPFSVPAAIWAAFLHLLHQTYAAFIPTPASSPLFPENMCTLRSLLIPSSAPSRGCEFGFQQVSLALRAASTRRFLPKNPCLPKTRQSEM